jgi:hypothetical protein
MTVTAELSPKTIQSGGGRAPARLFLKPAGPRSGRIDGAWWPRSRDLVRELPSLAAALDPLWGRLMHVSVNPLYWSVIPHRVPVAGHVVRVGWFGDELDPHQVLLRAYNIGRADLMVVPPETGGDAAARIMAAAADTADVRTGSALMAAEEITHPTGPLRAEAR